MLGGEYFYFLDDEIDSASMNTWESVESLSDFITRKAPTEWTVHIVNRTDPALIQQMADDLFDGLGIESTEAEMPSLDDDMVVLTRENEVVATSQLDTLKDTLLLVNADLYSTGTRDVEDIEIPEVVSELSDTVFRLASYPESNTEKLVLTLISRYIEQQALMHGTGTLRTSFQRLSRLDDEHGTRTVYGRLGALDRLTTHVYGVPDWEPAPELGVTAHSVDDEEIRTCWVVAYQPEEGESIAMVAITTGDADWTGYWTYNSEEVRAVDRYLTQTF